MDEKSQLVPLTPAIIILEAPTARLYPGDSRSRKCMTCRELFRISDKSYATLQDLRRRRQLYLVVCYDCYQQIQPGLETPKRGSQAVSTDEARKILGLP
jgi:hypothetical protein